MGIWGKIGYLGDTWNCLDFFIVVMGLEMLNSLYWLIKKYIRRYFIYGLKVLLRNFYNAFFVLKQKFYVKKTSFKVYISQSNRRLFNKELSGFGSVISKITTQQQKK